MKKEEFKICVVGLGYVGLPLALKLFHDFNVVGFDVNSGRISEISSGNDSNGEMDSELKNLKIRLTSDSEALKDCNFFIVAVPTPILDSKEPDLRHLKSASKLVGKNMQKNSIVVFESTVYPGATEEVCIPLLEKESGLSCGSDFKVGYSPERMNPGDKEHTVDKIVKVVSGMDNDSLEKIAFVYSHVTQVYKAKSIKVAEAAKVIENIQRDINIAFMNELSIIFDKLKIDTKEVLEAASTKWNFQKYRPGLVGGHCIGVDPYYLTHKAKEVGYSPQVILAGRDINESMSGFVADGIVKLLETAGKTPENSKVLILGLTFKENVPDTRNSKAADIISQLKSRGISVFGSDPLITVDSLKNNFSVKSFDFENDNVDGVLMFSPHDEFKELTLDKLKSIMGEQPLLFDIPRVYNKKEAEEKGFVYRGL